MARPAIAMMAGWVETAATGTDHVTISVLPVLDLLPPTASSVPKELLVAKVASVSAYPDATLLTP